MVEKPLVWLVDDDAAIRELLSFIVSEDGYRVEAFLSGTEVLVGAGPAPAAVLLDLMMPEVDGIEVLRELRRRRPSLPVIILTAVSDIGRAVEVTKLGAYDYLTKPVDRDRLLTTLRRAVTQHNLEQEVDRLRGELAERHRLGAIVGSSAAMRKVYDQVEKVLESDITVFISGESGTGKELVAKAIHYGSPRADGPFVDVNCAAIPDGLQESELFGHEKGAFTGAHTTHPGKFEQAASGTILLDEIGEMSPSAQARLLRVLQERCLQRVGGTKTIAIDARVLSSSNRDLAQLVSEGRFRQDLYYRLVVFPIELPPLRRRREDIPVLVEHFLAKYAADAGRRITRVEPDALELLMQHDWPGNVRELENVIHRSLLVASKPELTSDDLPRELTTTGAGAAAADDGAGELRSLEELERLAIENAIAHFGGNLSDVARQLGIGRSTLYRKLEQYGLRPTKDEG